MQCVYVCCWGTVKVDLEVMDTREGCGSLDKPKFKQDLPEPNWRLRASNVILSPGSALKPCLPECQNAPFRKTALLPFFFFS